MIAAFNPAWDTSPPEVEPVAQVEPSEVEYVPEPPENSHEGHQPPEEAESTARAARYASMIRNGEWLDRQQFAPLAWTVPGLIPEGFGLLTGPPKAGKSWLSLATALAVAAGGKALGKIPTGQPRPVLYLALEDSDRRMQDRCRSLLGPEPIPPMLNYATSVPTGEVTALLDHWLDLHGHQQPLVILDTLGRVMPPARAGESSYSRDYRIGSVLHALAAKHPGTSLVVVHHTRKAESGDWMDSTSGTNGLNGAADFTLNLSRDRNSDAGVIRVTGRDVHEGEYAITNTGGAWIVDGADLVEAAHRAEQVRQTANLGGDSARIVEYVNRHPEGVTPSQVERDLGITSDKARKYLGRLVDSDRIAKRDRGLYTPVTSVTSVTFEGDTPSESDTSDSSDTHLGSDLSLDDLLTADPDRCSSCGYHVQTQGHAQDCRTAP